LGGNPLVEGSQRALLDTTTAVKKPKRTRAVP
jgi:hypothetical protein